MRKASYWLGWSDNHRNTERLLQVQPKVRMTSPAAYETGWLFACVFSCPPARASQAQSADSIALARVHHVIQPHALSPYTRASVVRWLSSRREWFEQRGGRGYGRRRTPGKKER